MKKMSEQTVERKWLLTPLDRCDSCLAQAYVSVTGVNGELMFCSHHYNKIMNDPMNASLGQSKKEKIKGKKVSKKEAQDFFDSFSKEAGAIRPKNRRK